MIKHPAKFTEPIGNYSRIFLGVENDQPEMLLVWRGNFVFEGGTHLTILLTLIIWFLCY